VIVVGGGIWVTGAGEYAVWWVTNIAPPTVALDVPNGAVRGNVTIGVRVGPDGRAAPIEAKIDDKPLTAGDRVLVETGSLPDGPHRVTIVAEDRSFRKNQTIVNATLTTDNTPPKLALDSQPQVVHQGHTWLLRIRTDEPAAVEARMDGRDLPIEQGNGYGWAIVGFGPTANQATASVMVTGKDLAGNQSEVSTPVQVVAENFPMDTVQVEPTLASLLSSDIRTEEDKKLAENYQKVTEPKLWEGRFLMPVTGEIITEFGSIRSYNGGPVVGNHAGADIAAGQGRNVVAPAKGKVVVIDKVQLRGNIVILDHGLGVYTTYAHLSQIDVQVGQTVEKGQAFAKVGSTGLSTGPHLHWELWVGGQNVNPLEWTERDVP
jgi:murein DD-endopeptidase MepM/ murein hydrolase activator NlpD